MANGFTLGGMAEGMQSRRQQGLRERAIEQQGELGQRRLDLQQSRIEQQGRLGERRIGIAERQLEQERALAQQEQVDEIVDQSVTAIADANDRLIESGVSLQQRQQKLAPVIEDTVETATAAGRDGQRLRQRINLRLFGPTPTEAAAQEGEADAERITTTQRELVERGIPPEQAAPTAGIQVPDRETEVPDPINLMSPDQSRIVSVERTAPNAREQILSLTDQGFFRVGQSARPGQGGGIDFGGSFKGEVLGTMARLAPDFSTGATNDEQDRAFLSAVNQFMQPEQFRDPDTGEVRTRLPQPPSFVEDALTERGFAVVDGQVQPVQDQAQPGSAQQQPQVPQLAPTQQPAPERGEQFPTLPEDAVIPEPEQPPERQTTLFDEAAAGNLTGPIPAFERFISRVPVLGIRSPEETSAKTFLDTMRRRLIRALQTNPRFAATEQERIEESLNFDTSIIDQAQTFIDRMVGVDRALEEIESELRNAVAGERGEELVSISSEDLENIPADQRPAVSKETRQHALDSLQAIQHFRNVMMPPRMDTPEEASEFVANNPSGTRFIIQDDDDNWVQREVQ